MRKVINKVRSAAYSLLWERDMTICVIMCCMHYDHSVGVRTVGIKRGSAAAFSSACKGCSM